MSPSRCHFAARCQLVDRTAHAAGTRAWPRGQARAPFDETVVLGALARELDPDELEGSLERALDLLRCATGANEAAVAVLDPETGAPVFTAGHASPHRGRDGRAHLTTPLGHGERQAGTLELAWLGRAAPPEGAAGLARRAARIMTTTIRAARAEARACAGATAEVLPPPQLRVRCFGAFEVALGDARIPPTAFARRGAIALLKMLVLEGGRPISQGALAERFWSDVTPDAAANRVHGLVHALRAAIEPEHRARRWRYVLAREDVYSFDVEAADVDVARFRRLLRHAHARPNDATATAALEEAVSLYRGDLFDDEPLADWCDAERFALREQCVDALQTLARGHAAHGRDELSIELLRRALAMDPLREDLHRELVGALVRARRPKEARDQYRQCVRVLKDELDADPAPETRRLERSLGVRA